MQPFETDKALGQNPQPTNPQGQPQTPAQPQGELQAQVAYPTLERGSLPGQPQAQQGGYPTFQQGPQQGGYPAIQQRPGQAQPAANYQAPFPSQAYQQPQYQQQQQRPQNPQQQHPQYPQQQRPQYPQQPHPQYQQQQYPQYPQQQGGYPMYQNQQPQYYQQQPAEDPVRKQLMLNQMRRNIKASGQGIVILFSFLLIVGAAGGFYVQTHQDTFQLMGGAYKEIVGRYPEPQDTFSDSSCQAYMAGILNYPIFLFAFGAWHLISIVIALMNTSCFHVFHALVSTMFAAVGVFVSQQKCVGFTILNTVFGANNIPQNHAPFYFLLAGATFLACLLNCHWSGNKSKAERDQRNLALMMAA